MQAISQEQVLAADRQRRMFWFVVIIWAGLSWFIGAVMSERMRFRVNDLSVIPGGGVVMRDQEGNFYHVNSAFKARAIFPELAPPVYQEECPDCTLVTGEQMSQTNQFCASAVRDTLPELQFELPCKTWAPAGEGRKIMAFVVFIVPLMMYPILRAVLERMLRKSAPPKAA